MTKNKLFILTMINMICFIAFKYADLLGIGGYDVYNLTFIIPLYYNYLVIPFVVMFIILYIIFKTIKRKARREDYIILGLNLILVILILFDERSLLWIR